MADHFFPCLENLKHSLSLSDIDQAIHYNNNASHFSQSSILMESSFQQENPQLPYYFPDFHGSSENITNGSSSSYLVHDTKDDHTHKPINDIITSAISSDRSSLVHEKKRKKKSMIHQENSSAYSSPQASDSHGMSRKDSLRRGKKQKNSAEQDEKSREVVHVRAKRGQATDSHSLAERVRRGKINERLKCLQDIVPGCYKTMGMALMLDEIINYVQSLQNQVEFLSMKLTAASTIYDFNSDMGNAIEAMQRAKAIEALKVPNNTQGQDFPTSAQFDNFGYLPQFPNNR